MATLLPSGLRRVSSVQEGPSGLQQEENLQISKESSQQCTVSPAQSEVWRTMLRAQVSPKVKGQWSCQYLLLLRGLTASFHHLLLPQSQSNPSSRATKTAHSQSGSHKGLAVMEWGLAWQGDLHV